jgi:hypothetical protein
MDTIVFVAVVVASFLIAYLLPVRVGNLRLAQSLAVALWALKLASLWWVDLEPPGVASTFRSDGAPLPAWMVIAVLFARFGAWGALSAVLQLRAKGSPGRATPVSQIDRPAPGP